MEDWESQLLDDSKQLSFEEKYNLLEKLLDSDSTLFSSKIRDWLLKKDSCEILLRFIVRPPEVEEDSTKILNSDEYILSSNRRRDALLADAEPDRREGETSEEEEELQFSAEAKRADKAAEVFVYQASYFPDEFFEANLEKLVLQIFKIFQLHSKGDFDNFDKIFQSIFSSHAPQVVGILTKHDKLTLNLLNYLHDQAVSETLMGLLRIALPEQILINFYNKLNTDGFFAHLGEKIYGVNAASSYEDACHFFVRLVEVCSTYNNADVLFMDLGRNFTFVDGLLSAIANSSGKIASQQQVACIYTLKTLLLKSGEQLYDTSLEAYTPTPLPNMLAGVHEDLHNHLKTRASSLCAKLVADANGPNDAQPTLFSAYKVKKRFTMSRVALLDILVELAEENPSEVLTCFDAATWRVLSDWLFDHKFNNVYHNIFFKLFKAMLRSNHSEAMKLLFSKYKFVSRMIKHYQDTSVFQSGLRGFILLMCNYLRLTYDTLAPSAYLKNFLSSHEQWKEFVPVLRNETIRQMVTNYAAPVGGHINPFAIHDTFGMYSSATKCRVITPEQVDIDLGSEYANNLGFEDALPFAPPAGGKKKRKSRKKRQASRHTGENGQEEEGEKQEGNVKEEKEKEKEKEKENNEQGKTTTESGGSLSAADIFAAAISKKTPPSSPQKTEQTNPKNNN